MNFETIIPFIKPPEPEVHCTFCKRPASAVKHLIQSQVTAAAICNDCAAHAAQRIKEETNVGAD